jgi:hypothetical protein
VFGEADAVEAVQCATAGGAHACVTGERYEPGDTGVPVTVQRYLLDDQGSFVDCMAEPCGIGLRATGIGGVPGVEHYLRPVTIRPATVFAGRWFSDIPVPVGMSATGLHERTWGATVHQCVASLITEPFDPAVACGPSDAPVNPGYSTSYQGAVDAVRRLEVAGTTYDCAVVDCVVALAGWFTPDRNESTIPHVQEIDYRTMVYFSGGSYPSEGYRDGDSLRLFAYTYHPPGGVWEHRQCLGTPTVESLASQCGDPILLGPDSRGQGAFVNAEVTTVLTIDGEARRCGATGCTTVIAYTPPGLPTDLAVRPLLFRNQLNVSATTGLADGQRVEVEEIGVLDSVPGAGAWVMQCGVDRSGPTPRLGCGNVGSAEVDYSSHFVGTIDVRRSFLAGGNLITCSPGPCAIALVSVGPDLTLLTGRGVPISFEPPDNGG